jgi:hypothetical protein
MDWMKSLGGLLGRYEGAGASNVPDSAYDDFDQVVEAAPGEALGDGLAGAFRSNETPPFGQMVGQLFGASPAGQRASILNTLRRTVGPGLLGQVLSRYGVGDAERTAHQGEVPPEVAQHVPPDAVREIAEHAEQKDPSIIDRVSQAYAQQPQIVKTLGKVALAVALAHMVQQQHARR